MNSEPRFKVGDRILDTHHSCTDLGVGTILRISDDRYLINFRQVEGTFMRYFDDTDLILATPLIEALL